jgi:predicted Zn-dependent protease
MSSRVLNLMVLGLFVSGGILVSLEKPDQEVVLSAVLQLWSDALNDADHLALKLARVSEDQEMKVGDQMARALSTQWQEHAHWQGYVAAVGRQLVAHVRRPGIRYRFHAIDARQINAFAIPGGHIYVCTGMLDHLQSEAELAAILGHEIAHVDLRHCIERVQFRIKLKRVGLEPVGGLIDLSRSLAVKGYEKYQELDADLQGVQLSVQAGYDPQGAATVLTRLLDARRGPSRSPARTPTAELAGALDSALGSYFDTHPPAPERLRALEQFYSDRLKDLQGRTFYVGLRNYSTRTPRSQRALAQETVIY